MAISNCLFSPTSENPRGFSVWFVLAKLDAIRQTRYSRLLFFVKFSRQTI